MASLRKLSIDSGVWKKAEAINDGQSQYHQELTQVFEQTAQARSSGLYADEAAAVNTGIEKRASQKAANEAPTTSFRGSGKRSWGTRMWESFKDLFRLIWKAIKWIWKTIRGLF